MDHSTKEISIDEFINKELILFSMADNARSIPNVVDGFKPGHRKILFAAFKRKLTGEIKVAQFAGYVSEVRFPESQLCSTLPIITVSKVSVVLLLVWLRPLLGATTCLCLNRWVSLEHDFKEERILPLQDIFSPSSLLWLELYITLMMTPF